MRPRGCLNPRVTVLPVASLGALVVVYVPLAIALSVVDVREHRLPNRLVLALTAAVLLVLASTAALSSAARPSCLSALVLGAVVAVLGIVVALLAPSLIGMGDAKVAPIIAAVCALLGADAVLAAVLGVAVVGGLIGIIALARTRDPRTRIPYGPVLLAAPLWGVLGAPVISGALGTT